MSYGDVHSYPLNDLVEHVTDGGECPCGPTTIPVAREDGSIGYVISHPSFDGREHFEDGHDRTGCPLCSSAESPHVHAA